MIRHFSTEKISLLSQPRSHWREEEDFVGEIVIPGAIMVFQRSFKDEGNIVENIHLVLYENGRAQFSYIKSDFSVPENILEAAYFYYDGDIWISSIPDEDADDFLYRQMIRLFDGTSLEGKMIEDHKVLIDHVILASWILDPHTAFCGD